MKVSIRYPRLSSMLECLNMRYDAIIVLAGGIRDDGSLPENVKRRVEIATKLLKKKKAPRLLMSGRWSALRAQNNDLPFSTEASSMAAYAHSLGVPFSKILKEESSTTTFENAFCCVHSFIRPLSWKKLIIVSSDFHLPRVKSMFFRHLDSGYIVKYIASPTDFSLIRRMQLLITESIKRAVAYLKASSLF